ncbi:uncharacterized protein TNCV_1616571 [Trichonephila clavipes]|nr:uncharacterized protein TNCV_1616571 [Trichonephila clavipes]
MLLIGWVPCKGDRYYSRPGVATDIANQTHGHTVSFVASASDSDRWDTRRALETWYRAISLLSIHPTQLEPIESKWSSFGYHVVSKPYMPNGLLKTWRTDYAHLKQALSEKFPVVRNRSELETRFFASSQKRNQKPSDFLYDLLKIHKILKLEMTEEKLINHIISRLEPQILDYVEVMHPQTTSNLLQIIDKNRQENWRETRGNNRYVDNSRPRRKFNRFESQGVADNRRFDGRRRGGQSDHRFHNQGSRQGGSRNSAFRGQNDQNKYLNF